MEIKHSKLPEDKKNKGGAILFITSAWIIVFDKLMSSTYSENDKCAGYLNIAVRLCKICV